MANQSREYYFVIVAPNDAPLFEIMISGSGQKVLD